MKAHPFNLKLLGETVRKNDEIVNQLQLNTGLRWLSKAYQIVRLNY